MTYEGFPRIPGMNATRQYVITYYATGYQLFMNDLRVLRL